MASEIQAQVNNRICCFASNVKTTDDLLKYSLEDANCRISKDTLANIFMEILSCQPDPTDRQWYKLVLEIKWMDEDPPTYVYGTDVTINDPILFCSADGSKCLDLSITGTFNWADNDEANQELGSYFYDRFQDVSPVPGLIVTYDYDADTGYTTYTYYYDDTWGDLNNIFSVPDLGAGGIPFEGDTIVTGPEETAAPDKDGCLTSTQICDLVDWLTQYCKSCKPSGLSLITVSQANLNVLGTDEELSTGKASSGKGGPDSSTPEAATS